MRLPVLLNSVLWKTAPRAVVLWFQLPSDRCSLLRSQECLIRPKWRRRRRQQKTYRPKSFNTSCTSCDPFHQPSLRAGMLWLQLLCFLLLKASFTIGLCLSKAHVAARNTNFAQRVWKFPGAKVPRHFRSRERNFQGTKVPGSESSTYGTFAPGSESTRERKFQLPTNPRIIRVPPGCILYCDTVQMSNTIQPHR